MVRLEIWSHRHGFCPQIESEIKGIHEERGSKNTKSVIRSAENILNKSIVCICTTLLSQIYVNFEIEERIMHCAKEIYCGFRKKDGPLYKVRKIVNDILEVWALEVVLQIKWHIQRTKLRIQSGKCCVFCLSCESKSVRDRWFITQRYHSRKRLGKPVWLWYVKCNKSQDFAVEGFSLKLCYISVS